MANPIQKQQNGICGPVQDCTVSPYSLSLQQQQNQHNNNSAFGNKKIIQSTAISNITNNKNYLENLPAVYKYRGIYMKKQVKASYESSSDESNESVSDESLSDESLS